MSWFFNNEEAVQALRAEAYSWFKPPTPFRFYARVKGPHGGIDCLGCIEEWTAAVGLERFEFQRTEEDYSRHVHNDKILKTIRGQAGTESSAIIAARWAELPVVDGNFVDPPMGGDVLIYKDSGPELARSERRQTSLRKRIVAKRTGNGVFHMPMMMSDTIFLHCAPVIGMTEGQIDDPTYHDHLVAHFRARAVTLSTLNSQPSTP